jgi:predicted porin
MRHLNKLLLLAAAGSGFIHGSALAQSNVTVYGLVDAAVEYSNQGNGTLVRVQPGSHMGNRLGFRGTEDLGGGVKAFFVLESGFALDTGTLSQGGRLFGRQALVGLSNQAGSVSLGRQYSPYYLSMTNQDAFQYTMVGGIPTINRTAGTPGAAALLLRAYEVLGRVDNSIVYQSPVLNGFSGRLMYALGEVANNSAAGRVSSASLRYAAAPLDLNASYTAGRDAFDRGALKAVTAGGSYLAGPFQIFAGYLRETNNQATSATAPLAPAKRFDIINLGLRYQATPQLTLVTQAESLRDRSAGLTVDRDATIVAFGGEYALSKRTLVYSSIGTVDNQNGSNYSLGSGTAPGGPAAGDARAKTANIGIKHVF